MLVCYIIQIKISNSCFKTTHYNSRLLPFPLHPPSPKLQLRAFLPLKHIIPAHTRSYSIRMENGLIACLLLTLIVPSFALPLSMRSDVEHGNNLSPNVSTGIAIAICMSYTLLHAHCANIILAVFFIIPLLWCAYRLGTRARQPSMPHYIAPPRIFPTTSIDGQSNIPSSGQITRPHPAHTKVSRPTYRA